ncbi:MAG: hypothetical protein J6Q65_02540, partial [Lentisphaeria bacterium]|nr:hypothetical protein [Lentisphaeria bacterium]
MKPKTMLAVVFSCLAFSLAAQVEVPTPEQTKEWLGKYPEICAQKTGDLATHAKRAKTDKQKINAVRVAQDFSGNPANLVHYTVAPTSETQYLPDVYPFDGEAGVPVRIVTAQDEYEPGSFITYGLKDLGKVDFIISDLKTDDGKIFAKDKLDLKVIKVWYQNGNGWYSYFQDPGKKLCPELLLNDEELIKVDTEKEANFARLTEENGTVTYRWLTPPRAVDNRIENAPGTRISGSFFAMKPNFTDASEFKGATIKDGEFKQFFLTVHADAKQAPGLYKGAISLKAKDGKAVGSIPVEVRVLPFVLPEPKTYFDIEKDFLVLFCQYIGIDIIRQLNGNDTALARKQLVALLKNFYRHGECTPGYRGAVENAALNEEAGMKQQYVFRDARLGQPADMRHHAVTSIANYRKRFGTQGPLICDWGDEYGLGILKGIRHMVDIYKEAGWLFSLNSRHGYSFAPHSSDLWWPPVYPDSSLAKATEKFNFLGGDGYVGWYAKQHVGVENPAFIRRQYGLGAYRAGFSCHFNYAHHLNGFNDMRGSTYRAMNLVYGHGGGVLDTLAWEAFREGMDDMRYATKLQQLARGLLKNSKDYAARSAAKKALQLLVEM